MKIWLPDADPVLGGYTASFLVWVGDGTNMTLGKKTEPRNEVALIHSDPACRPGVAYGNDCV